MTQTLWHFIRFENPENFDKSFSEKSKRKQNFQSDFAPNSLTSCNPKIQLRQQLKTRIVKQC
ncbi:hypothetical protein BOO22_21305 [Vibrio cidicii]|nr:hypothetical protein [Vibrio cidicii]